MLEDFSCQVCSNFSSLMTIPLNFGYKPKELLRDRILNEIPIFKEVIRNGAKLIFNDTKDLATSHEDKEALKSQIARNTQYQKSEISIQQNAFMFNCLIVYTWNYQSFHPMVFHVTTVKATKTSPVGVMLQMLYCMWAQNFILPHNFEDYETLLSHSFSLTKAGNLACDFSLYQWCYNEKHRFQNSSSTLMRIMTDPTLKTGINN